MLDSSLGNWQCDKNILINFVLICAFSHQKQYLMYSTFETQCFEYTLLNSGFDFMKKISEYFVNNLVKKSKFLSHKHYILGIKNTKNECTL